MPEIPVIRDGGTVRVDASEIFAVMAYPRNDVEREKLAKDLRKHRSEPNSAVLLRWVEFAEARRADGPSLAESGRLAGRLLGLALTGGGTLQEAQTDLRHGRSLKYSDRVFDTIWAEYAPVAHLWAAWSGFAGEAGSEQVWSRFLALAESLRERGEAHRPKHASAPLLNAAETWRLPADLQLSRRINLIRELGQPHAR
jgi:hypothetical protein